MSSEVSQEYGHSDNRKTILVMFLQNRSRNGWFYNFIFD